MTTGQVRRVRCAIYTRKSSEEGLEQGFNSLDAQREACAAYILSQAGEGWEQVAESYDDGGLSGGTLERPGLKRLLADVAAGRVDIIVVYKVDRLTRSLLDFAKLVEAFDAASVSFVSITQSFNTTTSMGRLTLNMLLSFAQFEREVTAERIRDKIAASKARGMWMGGVPPLGYEPDGRSLAIVEDHAEIVRGIFTRYLALGSVRLVTEQLSHDRVGAPRRQYRSGNMFGGVPFTRGQIYFILRNPTYVGKIVHRDVVHEGLHEGIVDPAVWNRAQKLLSEHVRGKRTRRGSAVSVLAGRLVDDRGEPLIAVHACKGKQRYRYYVSRDLHHGSANGAGCRVPAREIETLVTSQVAALFGDPIALLGKVGLAATPRLIAAIDERAAAAATAIRAPRSQQLAALVGQVRVGIDRVEIDIVTAGLAALLGTEPATATPAMVTLTADVRLKRTGMVVRLVYQDGQPAQLTPSDPALLQLIVNARRWWSVLAQGDIRIGELATREGVSSSWMTRAVRLAFLSPEVVDSILAGKLRADLGAHALTRGDAVPVCWKAQRDLFLTA